MIHCVDLSVVQPSRHPCQHCESDSAQQVARNKEKTTHSTHHSTRTKIANLGRAVVVDQHVARGDVTVHVLALLEVLEASCHVRTERQQMLYVV